MAEGEYRDESQHQHGGQDAQGDAEGHPLARPPAGRAGRTRTAGRRRTAEVRRVEVA